MRGVTWTTAVAVSALALVALGPVDANAAPPTAGNSMQTGPDDNLSTKLNKSGGVITPNTSVDPGIKVPAPEPHPNSTPVIPPNATGGNTAK